MGRDPMLGSGGPTRRSPATTAQPLWQSPEKSKKTLGWDQETKEEEEGKRKEEERKEEERKRERRRGEGTTTQDQSSMVFAIERISGRPPSAGHELKTEQPRCPSRSKHQTLKRDQDALTVKEIKEKRTYPGGDPRSADGRRKAEPKKNPRNRGK